MGGQGPSCPVGKGNPVPEGIWKWGRGGAESRGGVAFWVKQGSQHQALQWTPKGAEG